MFKKIASNTISQVLSKAWTAIISIFLISILTNYFTIELYWLYSKVYNYIWIFVFLADLWLYAITIREITSNKEDSSKIVWNVMTLRLILWVVILFLSIWIAYFLPGYNSNLALISIFVASIFTIFQLFNSSILALMQANMRIEFSLVSSILWKIVNVWFVALIVYFLFTKQTLDSFDKPFILIMVAWVIWVIINTVLNFFYARNICKFWFRFDWDYIKYLFKISLPYWIALFLSVVYFKIDIILLSLIEWPELWDLSIALYSLPMKIVEVIMVVWWFYLNSILPSLTKFFEENKESPQSAFNASFPQVEKENNKLSNLIDISFRVLFWSACLIFVLWILFRDYLIEIVANRGYLETKHMFNSSDAFLIVFAVVVFYFISLIFIYILVASNNQWKLLYINIVVTLFNIIWNIILIPKFSFMWAWIVTLLSQILLMIFWYYYTKKLINFKIPILYILKNIIFALFIYFLFNYILINFSIWLYLDLIVYWWIWFVFYVWFLYLDFRKNLLKWNLFN